MYDARGKCLVDLYCHCNAIAHDAETAFIQLMFVAAAAVNDDNAAADAAMNDAAMNDAAAVDVAFAADVAEADSAVAASASLDLNAGTAANAPSFADNMLRTNHAASFFCSSPLQTEVSFQRND